MCQPKGRLRQTRPGQGPAPWVCGFQVRDPTAPAPPRPHPQEEWPAAGSGGHRPGKEALATPTVRSPPQPGAACTQEGRGHKPSTARAACFVLEGSHLREPCSGLLGRSPEVAVMKRDPWLLQRTLWQERGWRPFTFRGQFAKISFLSLGPHPCRHPGNLELP